MGLHRPGRSRLVGASRMPPPVVHYVGFRRAMVGVDVPEQLTRSRSRVWPLGEHAQPAGDAGNPVSPPIFLQCKSLLLARPGSADRWPGGPLTEVDLPCRRSEWHGSF